MEKSRKEGDLDLLFAIIFIVLGILAIIFMPKILTKGVPDPWADFSTTGQIGDTIGGITAPFLSLVGSALVFLALRSQIRANRLVEERRTSDNEANNLNQIFDYINDNAKNFTFRSFPRHHLIDMQENADELKGAKAFYMLFDQLYCDFHGFQSDLDSNPSISELDSLLRSIDHLLSQLDNSDAPNKKVLKILVGQLFFFKITPRIKSFNQADLDIQLCEHCEKRHGLPETLKKSILKIRKYYYSNLRGGFITAGYDISTPPGLDSYQASSYGASLDEILKLKDKGRLMGEFRINNRAQNGTTLYPDDFVINKLLEIDFIKSIEEIEDQVFVVEIMEFELPYDGIKTIG